jgi:tetratricopeptide (TPR) repeat protein
LNGRLAWILTATRCRVSGLMSISLSTLLLALSLPSSFPCFASPVSSVEQNSGSSLLAFGGGSDKAASKSSKSKDSDDQSNPYSSDSEAGKLFTLATRQLENREFKKARDTWRTLAYKKPQDVYPMIKVSVCASKAGDLDDSLEWAKKACVVSPKSAEAHLQLAHTFEENQDWKGACLQYEVIYEIAPNKGGKLNIEYPMLRSLIKCQEYDKAYGLSEQWIKEYKKSADAYFNRAWTLTQLPDQGNGAETMAEAEKNYRMALKLDPKRHDARFNLALLLGQEKQNAAACTELEKFIQEAPDDPDAERAKSLLSKLRNVK